MSKSVLVLETPENCYSCYLRKLIRDLPYCAEKLEHIKDSMVKPDWCPLKPLPEKMIIPRRVRNTDGIEYASGYNTCINEITGKAM